MGGMWWHTHGFAWAWRKLRFIDVVAVCRRSHAHAKPWAWHPKKGTEMVLSKANPLFCLTLSQFTGRLRSRLGKSRFHLVTLSFLLAFPPSAHTVEPPKPLDKRMKIQLVANEPDIVTPTG